MPDLRPPLLFLSHAGVDTNAARGLKARLLAAPDAKAANLRVWFDKDDLRAGEPWQRQLEDTIRHRSTAFAVYVGSRGVVNWVDAEVQLGLGRAITDPSYRFIPVLAPQAPGPEALPGFVALYQSVADIEGGPEAFAKLVAAVLGRDTAGTTKLEPEPFFGLKAVDEDRAHLFFGRERETEDLVRLLGREPLVMITGDSGSGKSSLVRAGLVPRWRGGALAEATGERPGDTIWHVVQAQPRTRPFLALAEAVGEAAKRLRLPGARGDELQDRVLSRDPERIALAIRCDLPSDRTRVLLLVDQFEELVTIAEPAEREPFVRLLLALADPRDPRARVVLTMRRDYYNLLSAFPDLYGRLEADGHRARVILGRVSADGLRRVVTEPLRLAGVPRGDRDALAAQVAAEMGDRPGDLALVQMALTQTWERRHTFDDDLLRAYAGIGRIEGAIARAAEDVHDKALYDAERALAEPVFIRLVRLGDTGGATRRLATRAEFDGASWGLVQKLASPEGKRLVLVGGGEAGETAEIAHEALVTQWPRYQTWLSGRDPDGADRAADKRVLDALTQRAAGWAAAPDASAKAKRLATGADLDALVGLAHRRLAWLSIDERQLVADSHEADIRRQRREHEEQERRIKDAEQIAEEQRKNAEAQQKIAWWTKVGAFIALVLMMAAGAAAVVAWQQRDAARQAQTATAAALADAQANLIWSKLEFTTDDLQPHEVDALWDLATTEPATRDAFLKQLAKNRPFILRLAQKPDPVLRALGLRLSAEQAQAALAPVLDRMRGATDPDVLSRLAGAVQALPVQLSAEQAQAALAPVLDRMRGATEPFELPGLAEAVQALPVQLSAEQAQAALAPVLDRMRGATELFELFGLAGAVQALAPKLSAEQAQAALAPVLDRMRGATGPIALSGLAGAVQALAPKLSAEQAQAALAPVLDRMRGATDPDVLPRLAGAVQALAPKLSAEQAQAALGAVLDWMRGTADPDALSRLAATVQALAPRHTIEARADLLRLAQSGIGAARYGTEAATWAREFAAMLPPPSTTVYISALVEVLKYPPAALRDKRNGNADDGEPVSATEYLISKLRERFPDARELQDGRLEDVLAWVAKNYPEIDLASPPTRPAPVTEVAASLPLSR